MTAFDREVCERLIAEARKCKRCRGSGRSGPDGCFQCLYCEGSAVLPSAFADALHFAVGEVDRLAAAREADALETQSTLVRLQPLLAAARHLAPNWRDTSGSAVSVDAITEGCEAVVRAVEAIDRASKEGA